MLKDLLADYDSNVKALRSAISKDDFSSIATIDKEIRRSWKNILEYETTDPDELLQLAEFLLEQAIPDPEPDSLENSIKAKVLSLLGTAVSNGDGKMKKAAR